MKSKYSDYRHNVMLEAVVICILFLANNAAGQILQVLHTFTGGLDGGTPWAGLTWDGGANFYGTAAQGGYTGTRCYNVFFSLANGCGTVFRLSRSGSNWKFTTLYEFHGGMADGNFPTASPTIAADGTLYGTTFAGTGGCRFQGNTYGCGTVFNLRPPATACKTALCFWTETLSFQFGFGGGAGPGLGKLIFDQAGDLYGTDWNAPGNSGEVFQLVPSGGTWVLGKVWSQQNLLPDQPSVIANGLVLDSAGNLYSTSKVGPTDPQYCAGGGGSFSGCGTVFQLTPTPSSWNSNIIYPFQGANDGKFPLAGLVADQVGNLYGATAGGGSGGGGVIFQLSPSGGSWTYNLLYSLSNDNPPGFCYIPTPNNVCTGPWGTLLMDSAGSLYGATYGDGAYRYGNVFRLTPSNGSWTYTDIYDFTGGNDGANPIGSLTIDGNGNLYGTTANGGADGYGVIFEIAP